MGTPGLKWWEVCHVMASSAAQVNGGVAGNSHCRAQKGLPTGSVQNSRHQALHQLKTGSTFQMAAVQVNCGGGPVVLKDLPF